MDDDHINEDYDDQPRYRSVAEIGPGDLVEALKSLAGFSENPFLMMQAGQLCMVDNLLNALEDEVMRHQADDDRPREKMALLGALSPMWIYAAYELQRTWRQRCEEVIKLADSGGLDFKAGHLERDLGYRHYDRELRADQLRDAQQRPELVAQMRIDLRRTEIGFTTLEFIRVALAKHEVSKKGSKKPPTAFAPGMARRNQYCGSMEYEMSNGGTIIRTVTRRDIAETIRFIPETENPSDEALAGFRAYMNPPDIDPSARG
ncbi:MULTISPECIES: hypothetical protein [unclassified Rhizobium]|uniref:hypothetical protein n=1 Tax=unclassified Rhizobium TaxID=2613769 RepID=UPI001AE2E9E7|nr:MULTISPECIES: hypothetical protein [unclassified Rhizobium]MBP2463795.1 hypothetical protein [Rhizobium sp. PvP014]MBP2532020.1 hypothetical protein [Rhizobium sp. PvP099]